jgi:ABC-2 type transport system permease protein
MVRLAVLLGPGAVLALVVVGAPPRTSAALLALPALVLGISANLCLQHALAGASFWLRDTRATWFLYQKLVFILGGMLLPLEILPDGLREVALRLPFMAMAYAPARLAAGHLEPQLLLVQAFWLVVLAAVAALTFVRGQRRLQVVGG